MKPFSIYIHIPFCRHRCGYCDFNTYAGVEHLIPAYVKVLCLEIERVSQASPDGIRVHTIYFGGGTPSLLSYQQIEQVLISIRDHFILEPDAEISLEANPGTLSLDSLTRYRMAGINRLSLGVQSIHAEELRLLDRIHTFADVTNAVSWAGKAGFENLSLDLIFGIPNQSIQSWKESLELICGLPVNHLSLYNLTIEDGTPLKSSVEQGLLPIPDEDLAADMYEWAIAYLDRAGFQHYEISNWARRQGGSWMVCRHNLQYWRNQPYFGFGAGAHGYMFGHRVANVTGIGDYIERCQKGSTVFPAGPATEQVIELNRRDEMQETMMLGLRLLQEGVNRESFHNRFGVPIEEVFHKEVIELSSLGLIEAVPTIRLTNRGCLVGNQVFMRFVGD